MWVGTRTDRLRDFQWNEYVFFPGWVNSLQGYVPAQHSLATLAPYRNLPDFVQEFPQNYRQLNVLPAYNCMLQGEVQSLVTDHIIGFYCDTVHDWINAFESLSTDRELQQSMSNSASRVYYEFFELSNVYSTFIPLLTSLSLIKLLCQINLLSNPVMSLVLFL